MLRRTLPALRSVKDGVTAAARQAASGDAHFPSLRGHPAARVNARESAEGQARLAAAEEERRRGASPEATTVREFQVYRWNPDSPGRRPFLQSYFVDLATCGPVVLDVLQKIKSDHDHTLAFRRSCREGICGSCSMSIDGVNTVACLKPVDADASRPSMITPLPHMFVVKDLVVDLTSFYQQYKSVEPWLKTKRRPPEPGGEHPQSPAQRKKLDGLYECILCACCSTACPSYWWNSEAFLGPAALRHAYRWVSDSRDDYGRERVQALAEGWDKLYRCRMIKSCTATCPKSLARPRRRHLRPQRPCTSSARPDDVLRVSDLGIN
ncbi:hypothetical protein PVAP13_2KG330600 [Panicum virgatum]|uniref:succinate dehydrogenase n=1 Tax=Panicum virgatum TaxID=38727 RepID=A0A8T0W9A3_PANVG|nr:hypothetical protein PVAP13_2KG330600 [Panicum virgatum]